MARTHMHAHAHARTRARKPITHALTYTHARARPHACTHARTGARLSESNTLLGKTSASHAQPTSGRIRGRHSADERLRWPSNQLDGGSFRQCCQLALARSHVRLGALGRARRRGLCHGPRKWPWRHSEHRTHPHDSHLPEPCGAHAQRRFRERDGCAYDRRAPPHLRRPLHKRDARGDHTVVGPTCPPGRVGGGRRQTDR
jgi:hypothetical protein